MSTTDPRNLLRQAITRYGMIRPGAGVLAAVSGGGDSVLMLHLLAAFRAECPFSLKVAHLNHGLRGRESDEDQEFVASLTRRLSLEFVSGTADLSRKPGGSSSVEERGRIARREFLMGAAREGGCGRIALGHTLDDQAETILMWLLRGTGRGGLAGMEPVTAEGIIRPLILVRRSAVRAHLHSMDEAFREDSSNEDRARTRNLLRAEILPLLDRRFPGAIERMTASAGVIAGEEAVLDELAERLLLGPGGELNLTADPDAGPHRTLASRAVRLAAGRQGMDPRLLERDHVEAILALPSRRAAGRTVDLPGGYRAEMRSGAIYFVCRERDRESGR